MSKTIWKFELDTTDMIGVDMPIGAEILTVQEQYGKPCLWALVDAESKKENRIFCIHGTGHDVSSSHAKKYVGTYQLMDGSLIFHVFELVNMGKVDVFDLIPAGTELIAS